MSTTMRKLVVMCATVLAIAFGRTTSVGALEPNDNTPPWGDGPGGPRNMNSTTYVATSGISSWGPGSARRISSSTDVDYAVVACAKGGGSPKGTIRALEIYLNRLELDLDMVVYDVMGNVLGSSTGVGESESVNLSAFGMNAAVIKVYGYNGAINEYSVYVYCE